MYAAAADLDVHSRQKYWNVLAVIDFSIYTPLSDGTLDTI